MDDAAPEGGDGGFMGAVGGGLADDDIELARAASNMSSSDDEDVPQAFSQGSRVSNRYPV